MRMETQTESEQKKIKKLNKKYNLHMLTWRIRGGKALGAKQKSQRVSKTTF